MPVELYELMEFAAGRKPAIAVGDLPRDIAMRLRCHPAIVFLGHAEFFKITAKHPEIKVPEFQQLPFLVKRGAYYVDPKRPNCVTIQYVLPEGTGFYTAGLRATAGGAEVWVQTFHRTNEKQMQRQQRAFELIRSCQ